MEVTRAQDKPSLAEVEDAKRVVATEVSHYEPLSEEEKALDRRVNLKMDFILLLILAIGFIVRCSFCRMPMSNSGSSLESTRPMSDSSQQAPSSTTPIFTQTTFPTLSR